MTSIADRAARPSIAGAADATARAEAAAPVAAAPAISFPAVGERELRLDLFRDRAHPAPGLADLCRARLPVHDLPCGDFLCRDQFREPALYRRDGHHGFPQAARRHHCPGAAFAVPSRQHGRAAALYRADAVFARHPVADEMEGRCHAGAVGRTLCADLALRLVSVDLSERLLGLQSASLA